MPSLESKILLTGAALLLSALTISTGITESSAQRRWEGNKNAVVLELKESGALGRLASRYGSGTAGDLEKGVTFSSWLGGKVRVDDLVREYCGIYPYKSADSGQMSQDASCKRYFQPAE